jgi:uncharacterized protein YbjT (DUF2867 family)
VLITGASGYLGRPLTELALRRGHSVSALVRPGSERRIAPGARAIVGNPLASDELARVCAAGGTLVHLIGTPRPNPSKAQQFLDIDLASARAAAEAAVRAGAGHIVYVSVAHPAPVMHAYIAARMQAEDAIRATGIPATILRPWYVLGEGHWWPYALLPLYKLFEWIPSKRESALRLGLVTRTQMVTALMRAIEDGPARGGVRDVPAIRSARL